MFFFHICHHVLTLAEKLPKFPYFSLRGSGKNTCDCQQLWISRRLCKCNSQRWKLFNGWTPWVTVIMHSFVCFSFLIPSALTLMTAGLSLDCVVIFNAELFNSKRPRGLETLWQPSLFNTKLPNICPLHHRTFTEGAQLTVSDDGMDCGEHVWCTVSQAWSWYSECFAPASSPPSMESAMMCFETLLRTAGWKAGHVLLVETDWPDRKRCIHCREYMTEVHCVVNRTSLALSEHSSNVTHLDHKGNAHSNAVRKAYAHFPETHNSIEVPHQM